MTLSFALLLACAEPPPAEAPPFATERHPGRRTASPGGTWEAVVAEGGALAVRPTGRFGDEVPVDEGVDARVAFSPDETFLVYARRGTLPETDLWRVDLPGGAPVRLTDWPGSEDRPVVSPDGARVALISGTTGIASWWVIDLGTGEARQLTNVGVEQAPRQPGHPPAGFVPVPEGTQYAWEAAGLSWVAAGERHALAAP